MLPCYIRREDGNGWIRGKEHHQKALLSFINTPYYPSNHSIYISVPHIQGGNFVAYFNRIQDIDDDNHNHLSAYIDEYGNNVQIMFSKPEYANYINRLTM